MSQSVAVRPAPANLRFLARQPILNAKQEVFGYELLFRAAASETFSSADSDTALRLTLDLSLLLGAGSFTEGRPAFFNCTHQALLSGVVRLLPRESVVLEILEDVPADEEVVAVCLDLKREGYRIALDDVVSATDRGRLYDVADIIKVDFLRTDVDQQRSLVKVLGRRGVRMLAEKVETQEQFQAARALGYTLFQGYFFCHPVTMEAHDLPSMHLGYMNILRKVYEPELDVPVVARAIREEPSLCYRLLRYLNSAAFGVAPVNSIVQALNLLGREELRKWVSLVTSISLAGEQSSELLCMALARARFCELIAEGQQRPATDYFLVGLFSLLDAILDRPLPQILAQIPVSDLCRDALCGRSNHAADVLQLAIATAQGYWETLPRLCQWAGCTEEFAWSCQMESQIWVRTMLAEKNAAG